MADGDERYYDRFGQVIPASDDRAWFAAIRAADLSCADASGKCSDLGPMVALLRSGRPLTQRARERLADLLESHTLTLERPFV